MCFNARKVISIFLTVAMLVSVFGVQTFAEESEAVAEIAVAVEEVEIEQTSAADEAVIDESEEETSLMSSGVVYYISTAEELNNVRDDLFATYYLENDIDLSSYGDWVPIGHDGAEFSGTFDGQGYEITGMTIGNDEYDYTGLFGHVTGVITNLGVSGTITTTNSNVGMLAGYVDGEAIISNCYTTGAIEANENVGGLVGQTYSWFTNNPVVIENCYSKVAVTGLKTGTSDNLGGLIGKDFSVYNDGESGTVIKRCYATGYIRTKNDNASYGGILGRIDRDEPTILFCYYDRETVRAIDTDKGFAATTAQMKTENIYTGWDFENIWGIDANINGGYPYLKFGTSEYIPEGSGTQSDPYIIRTQNDLIAITDGSIASYEEVYYELANDIELDAVFWTPIGGNLNSTNFAGYFDGAGYTISGLRITQDNFEYSGLFGYVTGKITNLAVDGTISVATNNVGMLAGYAADGAKITNCYTTGTIEANENVGGLVGQTYSWYTDNPVVIENCYSKVAVTGLKAGTSNNLGGLIGKDFSVYNDGELGTVIKRCYATGYIRTRNDSAAYGGILGRIDSNVPTLLFCYYDRETVKAIDTDKGFAATTAQMKTESIYTGWDFENIWGLNANINGGYPYLKFGESEYENEGSGSKYDPYMIYTQDDLIAVTEGKIGKEGSHYELANDIVLDAVFWTPIGGNMSGRYFNGYFEGAGHTISGLNITQDNFEYTGLFGQVTGTITNLAVDGTISVATNNVGMLAGCVDSGAVITNCYTMGTVEGNESVGGFIGVTSSWYTDTPPVIENCYSKVAVTGLKAGTSNNLGGLIGKDFSVYNDGEPGTVIKRCYATGYVNPLNDNAEYGGILGKIDCNSPTLLFCYYDKDTTKALDTDKGFAATTAQMKNESIYTGWDFDNIWGINANINGGYPYLKFGESEYDNYGSGSRYDPYMIYTQEDLIAVTEGKIGKEGSYYELANDIVLDAVFWTPIGGNMSGRPFNGYFDGKGYTISGLNITQDNFEFTGLFGHVTGTVTNLAVDGKISVATNNVGLLAGNAYNGANINNCYTTGSVKGNENVGGLIGFTQSWYSDKATTIENCYSRANVSGANTGDANYLGGLIGRDNSVYNGEEKGTIIRYCYATGLVSFENSGATVVGGILGQMGYDVAEVTSCYYDQASTGMSDTGKGIPLTSEQMKSQESFVGWDFDTVWAISSNINNGYPYLQSLIPTDVTPVKGVSLNKTSLNMNVGETETLVAAVLPEGATNKKVTWTSSHDGIATVSSNGVVTAKEAGTVIITVTTQDGGYSASCIVAVSDVVTTVPVVGVSVSESSISLEKGNTKTLVATVIPLNATNKNVTWTTSNANVASVSNGVVTAKAKGTAIITVKTQDGSYIAECVVTVTEKTIVENGPKIKISDIKTMPGKEIQVTVDLSENTGFASLGIEVGYDKDIMTLTNVAQNTGVGGNYTPAPNLSVNPYNMAWDSSTNINYNGNLATLTFKVGENVADGIYPITLDYYKGVKGNYVDGDNVNYDENFNAVGFVYISGNVIVASYIPGDINGDEFVDNKDATYLLRFLAGWTLPDLVEDALDTNGSGMVDNKDATILLRYLAGWDITLH